MSLLFPAFLAGLLALAMPWLLHRFNRETPPETPFPSTRFLESTRVPVSRKKRLRHLGLFSLRTLFLLAACLLFAQPYCSTDQNRGDQTKNVFVVIDRSASMRANDRWSDAVAKTAEVLKTSGESSGALNSVQLFDLTSTLTAHGELSTDLTPANSALRTLSPSFQEARYGLMMQQLDALASRQDNPVDVVFITDAQDSNLPLQRRLLNTQHIDQFSMHKVGGNVSNLAVRASARTDDGVNVRVSAQLLYSVAQEATSQASTDKSDASARLVVSANGREIESRVVTLVNNTPATVVIENTALPSLGTKDLEVSLVGNVGSDALEIDSAIRVPIQAPEPIKVGVGSVGIRMPEDAALFLRTALNTDGLARVIPSPSSTAGLSDDAKHWASFIAHTIGTDVQVPENISDFVSAGGNVLLILVPDEADENSLASPSVQPDFIGSVDSAHPLALGELNWQDTHVYTSVGFSANPGDRVLMRTGAGEPLLVERGVALDAAQLNPSAAGRLLILADPLDGVASDLPLQSAFVDWIGNTIRWFDASVAFPTQLNAGDSVVLPAQAQVLSPSGQSLRSLSDAGSEGRVVLREPGIYTVVTSTAEHRLVVTVPWEESNLVSTIDDNAANWGAGPVVSKASKVGKAVSTDNSQTAAASVSNSSVTTRQTPSNPWWPWLLPILALSLMAESLWANRLLAVRRDGM